MKKESNWLEPTDRQRSYYGKARVVSYGTDGSLTLISYSTPVCVWDAKEKVLYRTWGGWSATTMRHVNSFIDTYCEGWPRLTKKEWESQYVHNFYHLIP